MSGQSSETAWEANFENELETFVKLCEVDGKKVMVVAVASTYEKDSDVSYADVAHAVSIDVCRADAVNFIIGLQRKIAYIAEQAQITPEALAYEIRGKLN